MLIHHPKQLDYLISFSLPISLLIFAALTLNTSRPNQLQGASPQISMFLRPRCCSCSPTCKLSWNLNSLKRAVRPKKAIGWMPTRVQPSALQWNGDAKFLAGEGRRQRWDGFLKKSILPIDLKCMSWDWITKSKLWRLGRPVAIWNLRKGVQVRSGFDPLHHFDHSLRLPHVGDLLLFCSAW